MGSRCVTGRLLLVVVRPDRNVDAPVDGGRGRSLTDCVARLVSAPILARSWTPSVARVTAPASSILRDPHKKESEGRAVRPRQSGREAVCGSLGEKFRKKFCMPRPSCEDARARPMTRRPSSSRAQFLIASSSPTLSNPPELPNYSIEYTHSPTHTPHNMAACPPGRDIGRLSRCGLTSVQSLHALACRP
jgi:hypothetical protein